MAAAALVAGTSLAQAPAATAYPTATVEVSGNGYGHGRGLGQWGALGYALDFGWTYERILDHYYGGTTAGFLGGDPLITVRLTRFDGATTGVQQERGEMTTSAAPGTFGALRARRVGPNTFDVDRAPNCGGAWSFVARVSGPVTFSPQAPATDDHTRMLQACQPDGGRRWLRGQLLAVDDAGVQRTVNRLTMESYLRGVVPREVSASWASLGGGAGMHALRAQAIVARSYAAVENRSPVAKTCDSTSCQMYEGVAFQGSGGFIRLEQPATDSAVRDTAGQVRRSPSRAIARTEFSSSSGGWTAGGTFPAVRDDGDDTRSPYRGWRASIRVTDIEAAYPQLGSLHAIEVTERNGLGEWGGRVRRLALRGSSGTVLLTGLDFRYRLGLRSDWFVIHQPAPVPLTWLLRNSSSGGTADLTVAYGRAGDVPVVGDWDGDGDATPGAIRQG